MQPAVLVVDDKQHNRILIREYLADLELSIEEAGSGKECLEKLRLGNYSLVILDAQMPVMDGFQVMKEIRKDPVLAGIPVIMVSAIFDSEENILQGIAAGALDFLVKPINISILESKVRNFIDLYEKQVKLDEAVGELAFLNKHLRSSKQKLRGITRSVTDAIIMLHADFSIGYWNPAAKHIFGYNRFEVVGEDFFELLIPKDFQTGLKKVFHDQQPDHPVFDLQPIRSVAKRQDGTNFQVEISLSSYRSETGQINYTVLLRDITRRLAMQKEALAARELRETNKMMKQFMDNVSHELRTPMNAIIGISGMLKKYNAENLTAKQLEGLQIIHQNGNRLLEFINDVLDLSKIESRNVAPEIEMFDLDQLLAGIKSLAIILIGEKEIRFVLRRSRDIPSMVSSDPKKIERILTNLLSNAIKFTEKGTVGLYVHRLKNRLFFEVSDTGTGIGPGEQEVIFERFRQLENHKNQKQKGTGLGLHITRELIRLLEGDIRLESAPGKGTSMQLWLPVTFGDDSAELKIQEKRDETVIYHGEQAEKPLALIIEYEPERSFWIQNQLEQAGYRALSCNNSVNAVGLIRTLLPNLIFLKMEMPRVHGSNILTELSKDPVLQTIPVVATSPRAELQGKKTLKGVQFLAEPYAGPELKSVIIGQANQTFSLTRYRIISLFEEAQTFNSSGNPSFLAYHNTDPQTALSVILRICPLIVLIDGLKKELTNHGFLRLLLNTELMPEYRIFLIAEKTEPDMEQFVAECTAKLGMHIMTMHEISEKGNMNAL